METLRGLPSLLERRPAFRPARSARVIDQFTVDVVPLGERPGAEIAAGAVGRFWRLAGNEPAAVRTREDFVTETRVAGTSPEATRALRRYWRATRLGSGAIRRSWLAAIRRRAVRTG